MRTHGTASTSDKKAYYALKVLVEGHLRAPAAPPPQARLASASSQASPAPPPPPQPTAPPRRGAAQRGLQRGRPTQHPTGSRETRGTPEVPRDRDPPAGDRDPPARDRDLPRLPPLASLPSLPGVCVCVGVIGLGLGVGFGVGLATLILARCRCGARCGLPPWPYPYNNRQPDPNQVVPALAYLPPQRARRCASRSSCC